MGGRGGGDGRGRPAGRRPTSDGLRVHVADDPDRLPPRHRHDRRLVPARGRRLTSARSRRRRPTTSTTRRSRWTRRLFDERLWPALAARVPAFDAIRTTNAWAGYYEVNTYDHNAILGPHPVLTNLLFAAGFSGHGIQHAPAVGRAIAELVVHGRYVSLDLSVFGYERIAAGRRVVERNIIG